MLKKKKASNITGETEKQERATYATASNKSPYVTPTDISVSLTLRYVYVLLLPLHVLLSVM
jgi:hypothetical protein